MRPESDLSRRTVLRLTGSSLVGVGATGLASAAPDQQVEVNVGFSAERGRKAALSAADAVVREFAFDAMTVQLPARAASALAERADVRYVEENGRVQTRCSGGCGYDRIDADVACQNGYDGTGVDVAIIDTGIDDDHPDLQPNLGTGTAFSNCDHKSTCYYDNDNACNYPWSDDNDHGTRVAGVVASTNSMSACRTGVAHGATLHAVKVLDCEGGGSYASVAAGIEYTADQGWDVANLSFGSGSSSLTIRDACVYAHSHDVTLVAAAGNSGPCTDCVEYPAAYDECIAVGSVDCSGSPSAYASAGPELELIAPAENVYTTVSAGCATSPGSSIGTAFVTGAVAMLRANGYSHGEARQRLQDTAEDVGLSSDQQGYGLVDVAAALGLDSSDST